MTTTALSNLSRRRFIVTSAAAGAGFSLGFPILKAQGQTPEAATPEVNAWVVIAPDDTVTIRIARSEMGQGTLTGLAQLVAEELECDWEKVTTEYPTPGENLARNRVWGSFSTGGSRGIRDSHQYVREGGAAARMMLVEAAANVWRVPTSECTTEKGIITHTPSGRTLRYGEVASAAAQGLPPTNITLKDPKEWQIAGQPLKRLDTAPKLVGAQIYAADLTLPGMLNAAIKQCPVFGGTLAAFDAAAVENRPGVRAVVKVDDTAVAVVADTWWQAKTALDNLPITWDEGPNAGLSSAAINEFVAEGLDAEEAFVGNQVGDVDAALAGAAKRVTAVYSYPFQNHATLEPMNATARWTPERCEVWCPTQNGEAALAACAAAAELPQTQCEVYKFHLGGGFGRRGAFHDYVQQAVRIAKQLPGRPVKLLWSREEDMQHGMYHPITQARLEGGLDENGELVGLKLRIAGQSILAAVMPARLQEDGTDPVVFQALLPEGSHSISYDFPNLRIDHAMRNPPVPPGFWRGVNVNQNAIYLECFLDELAHAANVDPLAFRRKLMANHPKSLAVLEAVAARASWGKPAPAGVHRGLAVAKSFASYTAACAEVSVTGGELKIHRIVAATDPGYAVNPQQIEAQVEGSFVYGLSALLYGGITLENGRVVETNFDRYGSLRLREMPEVETIVMPSGGDTWGGVGEPTIAVAAPAVLNAIFAATGQRIRHVPLKNITLQSA